MSEHLIDFQQYREQNGATSGVCILKLTRLMNNCSVKSIETIMANRMKLAMGNLYIWFWHSIDFKFGHIFQCAQKHIVC